MDSILTSIKKLLGITEEYEYFDADIIVAINTVFSILTQMGIGPSNGFEISDKTSVWEDFVTGQRLNMVKTYVAQKVRLIFDPPQSGTATEAINKQLSELEWRMNSVIDYEQ